MSAIPKATAIRRHAARSFTNAGRAVVRGGKSKSWKAKAAPHRAARIPDYAAALACYRSPEYARQPLRQRMRCDFSSSKVTTACSRRSRPRRRLRRRQGLLDRPHRCDRPRRLQGLQVADMAPFGKFGGRFLVRGGAREVPEGTSAAAPWCLNFRATRRRSPATARPIIRRRRSCATATPTSISHRRRLRRRRSPNSPSLRPSGRGE